MGGTGIRSVHCLFVAACLFAVFIVNLTSLKAEPISHSESNSQQHLFKTYRDPAYSVAETLSSVSARSAQHGPLYFVLLNIWQNAAGRDLFSLRLLSLFCGVLAVAFTYRLAAIAGSFETAAVAAILAASVAYLNFYAQLVRMYSLLALLVVIVLWAYWQAISAQTRAPARILTVLAGSSAALIYVHYYGMIVLVAIGLYHALFAAKDRRWLQVCAAMLVAGLAFAPWLPVVVRGWTELKIPIQNLSLVESVIAMAQVYTNGLAPILVLAIAACLANIRLLSRAQRYLLFIALAIFLMIIVLNEFTPVLAARRMRYTIILAAPLICSIAIGLGRLPWRRMTIPALLCLWIVGGFFYRESPELAVYTNRDFQNSEAVPAYQDFHYQAANLPSRNSLILSAHPDAMVDSHKILAYYRWVLSDWAHVVHMSYDEQDNVVIQSGLSTYATLDAIAANSNSIWLIHDPRQTDLMSLDFYANWLTRNFTGCRRFIDTDRSIIEFYVKTPIPCELVTEAGLREILYDHGSRLGNAKLVQSQDSLAAYLWWFHTVGSNYSLSLQIFNDQRDKVAALDAVISGDPVDMFSFDLSGLSPGEYSVELIVYDFLTGESQPGRIAGQEQGFDRAIEIGRITIERN